MLKRNDTLADKKRRLKEAESENEVSDLGNTGVPDAVLRLLESSSGTRGDKTADSGSPADAGK